MTSRIDGEQIGYQEVRDYLRAHGWVEKPSKRDFVAIYRHADPAAEILVPLDRDLADYGHAMWIAAREVAGIERRPLDAVVQDLLQPRRDRLRFALEGPDSAEGTIAINDGVSLLAGVRKALLASAAIVRQPQRCHPRLSFIEAETYAQQCRLGQTEVGSYVVAVEAPHDIDSQVSAAGEGFGRRATTTLMKGVSIVASTIRKGDVAALVGEPQPAVSANLCEALVDMMPADERADLRLRATWSPLLAAPADVPAIVHIDRDMYESIERLGEQLRPTTGPQYDRFVGVVVELSGERGPTGAVEGDVVIQLSIEEGTLKARVTLNAEQYRTAANAHLASQLVLVKGVLHRAGRRVAQL